MNELKSDASEYRVRDDDNGITNDVQVIEYVQDAFAASYKKIRQTGNVLVCVSASMSFSGYLRDIYTEIYEMTSSFEETFASASQPIRDLKINNTPH